jgi:hypothetical protein
MGKTFIVRKVIAFSTVFFAKHISVPEERFYTMFVAVKKDLLADQCGKLEVEIDKAIETFNARYPNTPLKQGNTWAKTKKEINIDMYGNILPYSGFDGISAGAKVSAGYTSHVVFVDEAQEVNDEHFNQQIKPFLTRTSGALIAIGTTIPDVENVLYNMFIDENLPEKNKFRMDWEEVRKLKAKNSKGMADRYANRVQKEIRKYGLNSEYVQTQYYVSFDMVGDRFTTRDRLRKNGIFSTLLTNDIQAGDNEYVVAGFDPALVNDYAAMVVGVSSMYPETKEIQVRMHKSIIFNPDLTTMSITRLLDMVVQVCDLYKIDMLMVDATAGQKDRAYMLYKKLREANVDTLLVPYDYGGKNKSVMFGYLEDSMYSKRILLPLEEFEKTDKAYAELINEMLYMKKSRSPSGILQYKAPEGSMFFDDCVCALAEFNYVTYYVLRNKGKVVDFGDDIKYALKLHKNGQKGKKIIRTSQYM